MHFYKKIYHLAYTHVNMVDKPIYSMSKMLMTCPQVCLKLVCIVTGSTLYLSVSICALVNIVKQLNMAACSKCRSTKLSTWSIYGRYIYTHIYVFICISLCYVIVGFTHALCKVEIIIRQEIFWGNEINYGIVFRCFAK